MDFGINQGLVEEQYLRYRENPHAVEPSWRGYFEAMSPDDKAGLLRSATLPPPPPPSAAPPPASPDVGGSNGDARLPATHAPAVVEFAATSVGAIDAPLAHDSKLYQEHMTALVNGFRMRGHRFAQLDPLELSHIDMSELSLERFGLADVDPETSFATGNFAGPPELPLREFVRRLKETYCRTIGAEYRNITNPEIRGWLQERMESTCNRRQLNHDQQVRILSKLTDAEIFEQFLHTKYVGAKRFSLEGAESIIPLLELVIDTCGQQRIEEVVIGMAHRGRLNVLGNVMEKDLAEIFYAFEDGDPEANLGGGDVKYHMGYSSDRTLTNGHNIHLTLAFNPSHLEFVNPVVEGRVRAKQDRRGDLERSKVLPLLIHGDAAFIGQGVVAETLNLSQLRGYATGGTLHVVINNQIGFTTVSEDSRSTRYCTDIARMLRCPVFHVNGEDPEAVAQVVELAMEFRQRWGRDVVIDMYCYRRYGHNEADEPRFTQPLMYAAVDKKPTVREVYIRHLLGLGMLDEAKVREIETTRRAALEHALDEARKGDFVPPPNAMQGLWAGFAGGEDADTETVSTGVDRERIARLAQQLTDVPDDFNVHPKLRRLMDQRRDGAEGRRPIDWGLAEALAFASLVTEGTPVRLSGQDSRRGTFSHRHAVLHDNLTGRLYTPLAHMATDQGRFEVWDSPLSEAGVLGFEYGYSLDYPDGLIIWEAQFGDFCNGAQVLIDQFLSSGEDKWYRLSGLVLLLPHGFEGQGPEHSSARLERWLTLCAEDNMQVCNLTTAAQIFHALRRQVVRPYRKPLVIMSPKSLLRLPAASSTLDDLEADFQRIIPDDVCADAAEVNRVLLCSGKVYYDLDAERRRQELSNVAIVRLEQLYPLQAADLEQALSPYGDSAEIVWVQEEPRNMGAWYFIRARLPELLGRGVTPVTRPESASPATGSMASHRYEQAQLVREALLGDDPAV